MTRIRSKPPEPVADVNPVAEVLVDIPLAHLDRPFDYLVPRSLAEDAQPGVRVRVRFAGQLVDGFVLDRKEHSGHEGRLSRLSRVVSAEAVLTPEVAHLVRQVADRYAGTAADVVRLAVPPRHARIEAQISPDAPPPPPPPDPGSWRAYPTGPQFLAALTGGHSPRAVWTAPPGASWATDMAAAAAATLAGGRGALVIVPDGRDAALVATALETLIGPERYAVLTADLGPAERYRRWLAVLRGGVRCVVGTRAAAFAPVSDLGLVAIFDDGNDLHAEPRAPYPHAREVLLLRAHEGGAAVLLGGFARTAEAAQLLDAGWARELAPTREFVRRAAPVVRTVGDDAELARDPAARSARLPSLAWRVAREALRSGPVLVQTPRAGYVPALACRDCRAPARCSSCHGPLSLSAGTTTAYCHWCGRSATAWACPACGGHRWRAGAVGALRTVEELGRAFPSTPIRFSGRDGGVLDHVDDEPALVVATPGAEPATPRGYAAALLLDGWLLLSRPSLRAGEEALRRWLAAATVVRPAGEGGQVVLVAGPHLAPVQALVRWDPAGYAARELADRAALGFPPAARVAEVAGAAADLKDLLDLAQLPAGTDVLGPVPVAGDATDAAQTWRVLLRIRRSQGLALAAALRAAQGVRAARKSGGAVRVRIDPVDLG